MPGPLNRANIKPPKKIEQPKPALAPKPPKAEKIVPPPAKPKEPKPKREHKMLRLLSFSKDRFYPTLVTTWRWLDAQDSSLLVAIAVDRESGKRLILCQLWYHESVVHYKDEPERPVADELQRWVPVPVEGVTT